MDERKQYLYQLITSWRGIQNKELLDLSWLCKELNNHVLIEEQERMFPTRELAYYVLYKDGKSCVVIDQSVDEIYHKEIIAYSLLRIECIKKFRDTKLVHQLPDGTIMESFYEIENYQVDMISSTMMHEILVPSSELPVSLYQTLNSRKIDSLATHFQVRPQLIMERYQELSKSAKGILQGIYIRDHYQSSILKRYLGNIAA